MSWHVNRSTHAVVCLLLTLVFSGGCATKKPEPQEPKPQTIRLRGDASVSSPAAPGAIVTKSLFNIVVSPKNIVVNGVKVKNLTELEKLLAKHPKSALTIASHKCLSTEKAAEVMNLAQRYTDTPIAFGSYGNFDDAECK